jgi:D-alanyl-D-alanine carboxypeptidase
MSGINEIQSRIQTIQNRVASPPIPGRFDAVFAQQLAVADKAAPQGEGSTPAERAQSEHLVAPQAQTATTAARAALGSTAMTLGMMLGITSAPTFAARSGTVSRSDQLTDYLRVNNIEPRNGRLSTGELSVVSGAWNGTGYLLPPAAAAWEEMRAAAAADGVELRAIDTYRSYDVQEGAYQAHLRGEKTANVLPPGESEHGNGLAVDITNGHLVGVGDREYTWLRTNAAQYGWFPISNESWHWEFRGT